MLTRKQHELLLFIHRRLSETGVSPSFDEMKDALKLASKSGVHRLITALEERGFIRRLAHTEPGRWRLSSCRNRKAACHLRVIWGRMSSGLISNRAPGMTRKASTFPYSDGSPPVCQSRRFSTKLTVFFFRRPWLAVPAIILLSKSAVTRWSTPAFSTATS